jgi:hypothetical protein
MANTVIINSFPRTGQNLIKTIFTECFQIQSIVEYDGSTVDFSLINSDLHMVSILRNPLDSISKELHNHFIIEPINDLVLVKKDADNLLSYYIRFYSYILNNKPDILLLDYENVVSNFESIVDKINLKFNFPFTKKISYNDANSILQGFASTKNTQILSNDNLSLDESNKIILNLNNPQSSELDQISSQISSSSLYEEANNIFNSLKSTIQ